MAWSREQGSATVAIAPQRGWLWGLTMAEARERSGGAALSVIPSWVLLTISVITPVVTGAITYGASQATSAYIQRDIAELRADFKSANTQALASELAALRDRMGRVERHLDTQDRADGRTGR